MGPGWARRRQRDLLGKVLGFLLQGGLLAQDPRRGGGWGDPGDIAPSAHDVSAVRHVPVAGTS